MKNKTPYFIAALCPLLFYIINFSNCEISNDPEHWAFFGDYIGGVYSVVLTCLLTALMYKLNKKDEELKEKRTLAKSLFEMVNKFHNSTSNLDSEEVDKFRTVIINNEFIINSESTFRDLIDIADYYLLLCTDINNRSYNKEKEIRHLLKAIYNGR